MLLEVRNLHVGYGDAPAVWDASLDVDAGEIVSVIGPNGAGKTTLLNLVSGFYKPEGGTVRIMVMDEGPGLPDADRERVFDKFYRVRAGDSRRAGTGLGLAIARGFMEAMGGTITAANRTDAQGAVFTLSLPVPA